MGTMDRPATPPTPCELAEFFGVSPRTIDNWIAGQPEFVRHHDGD